MNNCPLDHGARVWCYARDSGGDEQCIDDQIEAIRDYCTQNGLVIERLFEDRATPGSSTAGRDQFQAMITLARRLPEEERPAGVVFWSFSRFSRDYDDAAFFTADLRRHGFKLVSISDDIPDGPFARIVESLTHWQNEQFLRNLSKDVSRGLHALAKQGYAPGGFPPRGYKAKKVKIGTKNDGTDRMASQWIPDPEKAPLIRKAFQMRAQGASYKEILDETGIYSSTSSLSCAFRNETYLGIRKCDDLRVEDAHEPLISQEIWDAVQETLISKPGKGEDWPEDKPHPRTQNSKHGPYLLSGCGILYCKYCGSAMYGGTDNVYNRPGNQIHHLKRTINEYLDIVMETAHATSEIRERIDDAGKKKKRLQNKLEALKMQRTHRQIKINRTYIQHLLSDAHEKLTNENIITRRAIVKQFVERIEIGKSAGTLTAAFPIDATGYWFVPPREYKPTPCQIFTLAW
jgi:DNA invertase Pin-like site-specific DNA recombinase